MIANHIGSVKASWLSTFEALVSFLRSPRVTGPCCKTARSKVAPTLWLFVLSTLITAAFAIAALPFILTSKSTVAGGLSNVLNQPVVTTIIAVVLLGPLIEEMMFRGWLNGTWQALIGTVAFIAIFYTGPPIAKDFIDAPFLALQLVFSALGLAIVYALSSKRPHPTIRGFERLFPVIFWAQGIVFGVLHFRNLYSDSLALPLLMTLPLVVCGWLWGYARVVLGLPAALTLHMAYNVPSAAGMAAFMVMRAA